MSRAKKTGSQKEPRSQGVRKSQEDKESEGAKKTSSQKEPRRQGVRRSQEDKESEGARELRRFF